MIDIINIGARFILAAALMTVSQTVLALGLGNASVESYLGQPLRIKIDLITRDGDDLGSVTVGLASADDFALIGASREAISVPLRFALEQDGSAASVLVTSKLPVKDPVIRLIVEVNWTNGRMLREYTLFLDPPSFAATAPSPLVDQRSGASTSPSSAATGRAPTEVAEQREVSPASPQPAGADLATGEGAEYGPVQSGDTLWRIATNWSNGTGLDLRAVMLAIQQENPRAFINDNINLLMQGVILRMPQIDDVRQIPAEAARSEVMRQNSAFTQSAVATAVDTPLVDLNSQPSTAAETGGPVESEDQLELVPPADKDDTDIVNGLEQSPVDPEAATVVEALREELSRKEEELIVEQQQNQYLQDQISELQDRLQSGQAGNVADADLAQLEERLQQERLSPNGSESEDPSAREMARSEATAATPPAKAAVPQVTPAVAAPPAQSWYRNMMVWLIALLVLAAAFAGWLLNRRKVDRIVDADLPARDSGTVREIKDEAEEILQVLKTDQRQAVRSASDDAGREVTAVAQPPLARAVGRAEESEEAELLDEDSTDPEVRLDLARAYISMGDREAARVILEEVMEQGTEEQQTEARKMMGEL
jgi:pilus assembly protein FimV